MEFFGLPRGLIFVHIAIPAKLVTLLDDRILGANLVMLDHRRVCLIARSVAAWPVPNFMAAIDTGYDHSHSPISMAIIVIRGSGRPVARLAAATSESTTSTRSTASFIIRSTRAGSSFRS